MSLPTLPTMSQLNNLARDLEHLALAMRTMVSSEDLQNRQVHRSSSSSFVSVNRPKDQPSTDMYIRRKHSSISSNAAQTGSESIIIKDEINIIHHIATDQRRNSAQWSIRDPQLTEISNLLDQRMMAHDQVPENAAKSAVRMLPISEMPSVRETAFPWSGKKVSSPTGMKSSAHEQPISVDKLPPNLNEITSENINIKSSLTPGKTIPIMELMDPGKWPTVGTWWNAFWVVSSTMVIVVLGTVTLRLFTLFFLRGKVATRNKRTPIIIGAATQVVEGLKHINPAQELEELTKAHRPVPDVVIRLDHKTRDYRVEAMFIPLCFLVGNFLTLALSLAVDLLTRLIYPTGSPSAAVQVPLHPVLALFRTIIDVLVVALVCATTARAAGFVAREWRELWAGI